MTLTLFGIPNCDTVKKARVWFDSRSVAYAFHDYKKAGIDAATLSGWAKDVGWEVLLNRAGTTWRKLSDEAREGVDEAKAIALMVEQPSLIKRPVVTGGDRLLVGFKPAEWEAALG